MERLREESAPNESLGMINNVPSVDSFLQDMTMAAMAVPPPYLRVAHAVLR